MYCRTHPTRSGVCTCSQCGDWLCEECAAEVDGRVFCKSCAQKLSPAIPGHTPCHAYTPRYISWGVLFIFSFLAPGINYMYEGLIKRGLFALSSFFLCAYLAAILNQPFFGCLIPILWITCIFDGFHIRRKINAGVTVEDSIDDVLGFLKKN
ncbi:MAG: hypothetical protein LBT44_02740, partial [Clostridiales bacterium]|nr:hypothetical protein [Clostridiales bacterium]